MQIQKLSPNFKMPTKGTDKAGAFDIYMPKGGICSGYTAKVPLGFAAAVPDNHVALLLPRSGAGALKGVELNNTCGVIDSDYRGEWAAFLRTKDGLSYEWQAGDRVLQFLIVPIAEVSLELVDQLDTSERGFGGFGSTGK